jgi:hypothetical protein
MPGDYFLADENGTGSHREGLGSGDPERKVDAPFCANLTRPGKRAYASLPVFVSGYGIGFSRQNCRKTPHPNVKTNASRPGSRKRISKVRSFTSPACRTS